MKKKSISGKVLASVCSLIVFGGATIGTTVALFTSKKTVNTHLQVGKGVLAELYLTEVKGDYLTDEGLIEERTEDLTSYTSSSGKNAYVEGKGVNLFDYDKALVYGDSIVPTMTGSMSFCLYNVGDIAFTYDITETFTSYDEDGKESEGAVIGEQIEYSIEYDEKVVKVGEYATFKVTYEFKDDVENNEVVNQSFDIDLMVSMVQVTKK